MEIEEYRYPKQIFEYEYFVKDKCCCGEMHICWNERNTAQFGLSTKDEFNKNMKELIKDQKVKFCPFCGEEIKIVIDRGDVG